MDKRIIIEGKMYIEPHRRPMLIIEDFDSVRSSVGKYFQDNGFNVISVGSAHDAISLGRLEEPEIVVIDHDLKHEDPYSVISSIHTTLPDTFVVLVCKTPPLGHSGYEENAGVQQLVGQSFDPASLRDILEKVNAHLHILPKGLIN
jgi:DNA-binding NtrC family response regulator